MSLLLQLAITGIWAMHLTLNTRRLLKLAHVNQLQHWDGIRLRSGLNRVWWWLGQQSFWQEVQRDSGFCLQMTMMLVVMAWSL
jgi:hypothetical protein